MNQAVFSKLGNRLAQGTGIGELMEDLGNALASPNAEFFMLGGGNPALIPEVESVWKRRWKEISEEEATLTKMLGVYDPPQGNPFFLKALADFLNREFGWPITSENLAVSNGGQTAFYQLFNLLAGETAEGVHRKILLPLSPEYIGYADQGMGSQIFHACPGIIQTIGNHVFKYHVDFKAVEAALEGGDIAAIAVSRPTNPSGNVLTDEEMKHLSELARRFHVPLIVDNAYGLPFPGICFTDVTPLWEPHWILTLSLSKLGLPGTRTAFVIAAPEIIKAFSSMTAVSGLANGNLGQVIVKPLIESGEILKLSQQVILPYYREKSRRAIEWLHEFLPEDIPWRAHTSEGALFLWLWFPGLPGGSKALYEALKEKGVLVVPGTYFFFGLGKEVDWAHRDECVRLSFAMPEDVVRGGIQRLAEVLATTYGLA